MYMSNSKRSDIFHVYVWKYLFRGVFFRMLMRINTFCTTAQYYSHKCMHMALSSFFFSSFSNINNKYKKNREKILQFVVLQFDGKSVFCDFVRDPNVPMSTGTREHVLQRTCAEI